MTEIHEISDDEILWGYARTQVIYDQEKPDYLTRPIGLRDADNNVSIVTVGDVITEMEHRTAPTNELCEES